MRYDTIRFKVMPNFVNFVKDACESCKLPYIYDPTGWGDYLFAIEPRNKQEWFMAHGIEVQSELFNTKGWQIE